MGSGWIGKILRADLKNGIFSGEPLALQDAERYVGGRGLGTSYFLNEAGTKAEPFGPENRLIFMTGPLTGTLAPCAGRCEIVAKSPLTGTLGACSAGGYFGPELKFAGYDGIVLEGRTGRPSYLYIRDDRVELRDAGRLWGMGTSAATEALLKETDEEARVACIGPAGEKRVAFAVVVNDKCSAAGCAGLGAVMGSKNLKAIVVKGTRSIRVALPKEFLGACVGARNAMRESAEDRACLDCNAGFGRVAPADPPRFAGLCEGQGWETDRAPAPDFGGIGARAARTAAALCRELGMDAGAMSAVLACAAKLYEKGDISLADTGVDLSSGSAAVLELIRLTGSGEGFGQKLAPGLCRMASGFGHPELSAAAEKAPAPCRFQDLAALADSAGICRSAAFALGLPAVAQMLRTGTGLDVSDEEFRRAGERIRNLGRGFDRNTRGPAEIPAPNNHTGR